MQVADIDSLCDWGTDRQIATLYLYVLGLAGRATNMPT